MSDNQNPPANKLPRAKPARGQGKTLPVKAQLNAGVSDDAVAAELAVEPVTQPSHQTEDTPMETVNTNDTANTTATDMGADMQARAQAAFAKGSALTADMTDFAKGNVEAMMEAGKLLAAGMQDLGRTAVEDAKAAAETVTADVKAMAAVKSPTELFQLQGEIMRRNLDAMVAKTSHNAEAIMKLANDMVAPLSTRASLAMEKLSKAA